MESFLLYGNAPHNDKIRRRARSTSENITNSFHDDFVKKNAEFRNDAGMKSYLNRQTDGSCCKWCTKIAGRYDYGKAPEDIFKRHDNCTCTVTFESGRFRQDVWTKKSWEEAPKGVKTKKPTVLSQEQGQAVQNSIMSQYMGIDKYPNSDIIESKEEKPEIPKEIIDDVNDAVNKVAEDFPVIKEQVEHIVFADTGSALGENGLLKYKAVNVIRLSEYYCSDYSLLKQKLEDDFKSGFSYETDNSGSLACHELGHALHKILAMKRAGIIYGEELTPLKRFLFEKEFQKIKEEVYLASFSNETLEEIDKLCISELGKMTYRNSGELIAQSFGNYYYGKNKSKVGQSIVEYFKEWLN